MSPITVLLTLLLISQTTTYTIDCFRLYKMSPITVLLTLLLITPTTTYTIDCSFTSVPHYRRMFIANPNSFIFLLSDFPMSYDLRYTAPQGTSWRFRMMELSYQICVFTVDFDRQDTIGQTPYPRWLFWSENVVHDKDTISRLHIFCPSYTSWDIFNRTFPIEGFTYLSVLRLECPIKEIYETFFAGVPNLFDLHFGSNVLMSVNRRAFEYIPHLAYLTIHSEHIAPTLIFDIFCPLPKTLEFASFDLKESKSLFNETACNNTFHKLIFINVHDDTIQHIKNTTFTLFPNIKMLYFYDSQSLTDVDAHAFDDLKLYKLQIQYSKISILNIPEVASLRKLYFQNNNITSIKGRFGKDIQHINLDNNSIANIPNNTFIDAVKLKMLFLRMNNINTIESHTFQSQFSLRELDLSINSITHLEKGCFKSLLKLQILKLYNNMITTIEDDILTLPNLYMLDLNYNQLTHLNGKMCNNLPKLQHLYLSNNLIKIIPDGLFHNLPLLTLGLSTNKLRNLSCDLFGSCNHSCNQSIKSPSCRYPITKLWLNNNQLTNDSLCFLQNSHSQKNCSSNKVYKHLPQLTTLGLDDNSLEYINIDDIEGLPELKLFSFSRNPFNCSCDLVPFSIWMKSHKALIDDKSTESTSCVTDTGAIHSLATIMDTLDCTHTVYHTKLVQNYRVILSLCATITIVMVFAAICGYFRMEIAVILYSLTGIRLSHDHTFVDKRYNLMIWCHDHDIKYASDIIQVLERYFTVYWNQRDCMPGEITESGFEKGVTSSEQIIVILTRNFVTDYLCQFKFENLHISLTNRDFGAVFIVADNDVITYKHHLYERIRAYVRTRQYLRHDDRLFWKKLLYKLPNRRDPTEPVLYRDLVAPHIDFTGQQPLGEMLGFPEKLENDEHCGQCTGVNAYGKLSTVMRKLRDFVMYYEIL